MNLTINMHFIKSLVPQKIKNIYHLGQAILANIYYGFPSRKIKIIGVTGTNGKTTTVQMISKILEESGQGVAALSTISFKLGKKEWVNKTKYTTLSSFKTQKFIKEAVQKGCKYLVLETSSHSLDQYRVWGVDYATAVITNITREHLDYHKTMEKYSQAKERLFKVVNKKRGTVIINLEMERADNFLKYATEKTFGYGFEEKGYGVSEGKISIVQAKDLKVNNLESSFSINGHGFKLSLPGRFNVENALASICVGISESISLDDCSKALEKIKRVLGRMEKIPNDRGLDIIIDYAVTPDSLNKLYAYLSQNKKNEFSRIISVFGSCGERDRGKRPIMGEIVSKYADFMIITNEDPYFEDPKRIIDEVSKGIENKKEGKNFFKILDRRDAIKKALEIAAQGDLIVVTGKGAEETMAIKDERVPWNDKAVVLEELKKLS